MCVYIYIYICVCGNSPQVKVCDIFVNTVSTRNCQNIKAWAWEGGGGARVRIPVSALIR